MSMDLTFLGTGSAYPSPHRGASALVLRSETECWLFDCGEGTQTQLMKSQVKASKINKIFITHLHGDHLFGLPGLLCTLSMNCTPQQDQEGPCLEIFGPMGLRHFLYVTLQTSSSELMFPYTVHELELSGEQGTTTGPPLYRPQERPGRTVQQDADSDCYTLLDNKQFLVYAFPLCHRVPSFGFCVQEKERPGCLKVELLKELGLKPGPLYGRLKSGECVTLESGLVLEPKDVLEPALPGRKVCVLGDCSAFVSEMGRRTCKGADVLVHEATLEDEQQEKAIEHGHSTPKMAAATALACEVHTLVLNHFSQRYKPVSSENSDEDNNVSKLKRQAEVWLQGSHTRVIIAEDFLTLDIPLRRHNVHKTTL